MQYHAVYIHSCIYSTLGVQHILKLDSVINVPDELIGIIRQWTPVIACENENM